MPAALLSLDDRVAVAGQLTPGDMAEIAAAGFVAVVNNRPDGEALFGQPRTADLRQAAEAAGLVFLDLPFSGPRATPAQVRAFAGLLAERPGPCRGLLQERHAIGPVVGRRRDRLRPVARRGPGRRHAGGAEPRAPRRHDGGTSPILERLRAARA